MRCTVALATIQDGRSSIMLKAMLAGLKPSDCSASVGLSGGGTSAAGNRPAVPSRRTVSMRPANSVRSVPVSQNSLKK